MNTLKYNNRLISCRARNVVVDYLSNRSESLSLTLVLARAPSPHAPLPLGVGCRYDHWDRDAESSVGDHTKRLRTVLRLYPIRSDISTRTRSSVYASAANPLCIYRAADGSDFPSVLSLISRYDLDSLKNPR